MASRTWPLTVRQEAGVRAVPPTFAVRGATRARVALSALGDRLGLPMQVLLERLLGVLDAPALCALVELDIPDGLDRPRTAAELAAETGSDAAMLDRLLSYLASRGCLRRDRKGRYSANRVTRLLTRDGGWSGWVRLLGSPWTMASYAQIIGAVRDGTDPIVAGHGVDFFGYLAAHPANADAFHDAMAAGARLQAVMIGESLGLADARVVLDVGGGTGALISHLLATYPELAGAVLDLAEAQAGASAMFAEAGVSDRAEFIAGDFFASVPSGYDVHMLTAVLHDWNDDDCVRILSNCGGARRGWTDRGRRQRTAAGRAQLVRAGDRRAHAGVHTGRSRADGRRARNALASGGPSMRQAHDAAVARRLLPTPRRRATCGPQR